MAFKGFFRKFSKTLGSGIAGIGKAAGGVAMGVGGKLLERGLISGAARLAPSLGALLL
jgi:hypothetical protein